MDPPDRDLQVVDGAGHARLEPVLPSVAQARRLVSDVIAGRDLGSAIAADAALIVSELVTNAVLHARTPIEVVALVDGVTVHIEVRDNSDLPVLPPKPDEMRFPADDVFDEPVAGDLDSMIEALSTTGRGMELVTKLASRWGVTAHVVGKTVWAEIGADSGDTPIGSLPRPADGAEASTYTVTMVAVPVRLLVESDRYFDDALRELQFIALTDTAEPLVATLADRATTVAEAMRTLRQQVRDALGAAQERGDRLVDLYLTIPDGIHEWIGTLEGVLEQILDARRAGLLLISGPSPEAADFRVWLTHELRSQLAGAAPQPCPFAVVPTAPEPGPVGARLSQRRQMLLDALETELASAPDVRAVAAAAVRRVAADTGASFASLVLVDDGGEYISLAARVGYASDEPLGRRYPVASDNPVSEVVRTATPIVLRTRQERVERYPRVPVAAAVEASPTGVWVPLGERPPAPGALVVGFSQARDFTGTDLSFLLKMSRVILERLDRVRQPHYE